MTCGELHCCSRNGSGIGRRSSYSPDRFTPPHTFPRLPVYWGSFNFLLKHRSLCTSLACWLLESAVQRLMPLNFSGQWKTRGAQSMGKPPVLKPNPLDWQGIVGPRGSAMATGIAPGPAVVRRQTQGSRSTWQASRPMGGAAGWGEVCGPGPQFHSHRREDGSPEVKISRSHVPPLLPF